MAAKHLQRRRMSFTEASGYGLNSQLFEEYSIGDSQDTLTLYELAEKPEDEEDYLIKCRACRLFGEMSLKGVPINTKNAYEQYYRTEAIEEELEDWIKHELGSTSDHKISKYLVNFSAKDLKYTEKGKISAGIGNLKKLAPQHEMISFIHVWKLCKSWKNTYLKEFILAGEDKGRW